MRKAPLLALLAVLGLLSLVLLVGLSGERRARGEARRLVATALAGGQRPERQAELFRRARKTDPAYGVGPCEKGMDLERRERFQEAAASFQSCRDSDPQQAYALLGYARTLLRAQGTESYVEVRSALRHFLEMTSTDPADLQNQASRRSAIERVSDLETLLAGRDQGPETPSRQEILRILLKRPVRGASRYDGPRVPLRLGFAPGDSGLGPAAEEQLREVAGALRDGSLAGARILIEGHTDSVEGKTRRARLEISLRRAESVKIFLARQGGVRKDHLRVSGYADDYPLRPNATAAGCAANRRVEILNTTTQEPVLRDVRDPLGP
jgi:outer membrane protein OmpA-like peptidoglycan-associated protein